MPIFKDSYQTTVGSVFNTKPIQDSIKEAIIKDGLEYITLNVKYEGKLKPIFVTGMYHSESDIPLFTHPITIFNFQHNDFLCTDIRMFVNADKNQGSQSSIETSIRNMTEYNFAKSRAILNLVWLDGHVGIIKNGLQFAGTVFSAWLAESIAKTYALDFKDQTTLNVLTNMYYQSLFIEGTELDKETKERMVTHTIKATGVTAEYAFGVFDKVSGFKGIECYCNYVREVLENVRLKNFNLAVLLTIIKNSWYGANAKEIISVALEHPPTWCAVVYSALTERTYKTSMIFRVAERFSKRGTGDEFLKNYSDLVKQHINVSREEAVVIKDFE